jgi:hypothetical protein
MNELTAHPLRAGLILLVVICAMILLLFPFTNGHRKTPRWVGRAFAFTGLCSLVWATVSIYLLIKERSVSSSSRRHDFSDQVHDRISRCRRSRCGVHFRRDDEQDATGSNTRVVVGLLKMTANTEPQPRGGLAQR